MPSVSGNVGAVASVSSVFGRNGGVVAANGDYSGVVAAHLTGATAATRYVGGTASGAPVAGTFAVGDFVIEQTGKVYVCTVAGTPGTWVAATGYRPVRDVGQAYYNATNVPVLAGATTIPWTLGQGDATLLDLTTPTLPAVAVSGVYAAMAHVTFSPTIGTPPWSVTLIVDYDFYGVQVVAGSDGNVEEATVTLTGGPWFIGAGAPSYALTVTPTDAGTFTADIYVQRIA